VVVEHGTGVFSVGHVGHVVGNVGHSVEMVGHSVGMIGHSVGQVVTNAVVSGHVGQLLLLLGVPAGQKKGKIPF